MRIYYYGKLADLAGTSSETRDLPSDIGDTKQLRDWLVNELPFGEALANPTVRIAVNDELHAGDLSISNADEVAFLPPVGGG